MPRIRTSVVIDAPPARVWEAVCDIGSHVAWMADAESIRFTSDRRAGVGTTFDCTTRVGPLRLLDRMEITAWDERRTMGVRHVGLVTGSGRFTLRRTLRGRTRFSWEEELRFPWWLGGRVGGAVGSVVLRLIWRGNLRRLKRIVEGDAG